MSLIIDFYILLEKITNQKNQTFDLQTFGF
jgi:hypothetical protein